MTDTRRLLTLPPEAKALWEVFSRAGKDCYFVGGCVRDALLGSAPGDYDVCTPLLPEEIIALFDGFSVIPTGIRHGTITVLIAGIPFEVTTFRVDGDYTDCRHPDSISFTKELPLDLSRRDFTVNAMAWNPSVGLVDPFGGREDLQKKIIRCVGDPRARFSEDALRIVRALRFAARLDFTIEEETARAAVALAPSVQKVSRERLLAEFRKLLLGISPDRVLRDYQAILTCFLPPILPHPPVESLPPRLPVRFAALFGDAAKTALRELKAENRLIEDTAILAANITLPLPESESETHRRLIALGRGKLQLMEDELAWRARRGEKTAAVTAWMEKILRENLPLSVRELPIGGDDLLPFCQNGREVGEKLERLLYAVADRSVAPEKNALLAWIIGDKS